MKSTKKEIGKSVSPDLIKQNWVQTEKQVHDAWADLIDSNAQAAKLLHKLVALCDKQSAVVISQEALTKITKTSSATVKRSIATLKNENWIQVINIGKGGIKGYVINSRVCWTQGRDKLETAIFTANVYVSKENQSDDENQTELKRIPILVFGSNS